MVVPLLALALGVDLRYAIGASLISVIATSSGAAAAYVKEGFANIRIGMFLEVATTAGAVAGALIAVYVPTPAIAIIFGGVLLYSAYASWGMKEDAAPQVVPDGFAERWRLGGSYPGPRGDCPYSVTRVPAGFGVMFVAGILSGLLGIGSGAVKVLAMDQIMRMPFKVSTTTSNFMIGVTAAASAGIYFGRGYIEPGLAMPVMLGVGVGALLGTRVLIRAQVKSLRLAFSLVVAGLALEMIYSGLTGKI